MMTLGLEERTGFRLRGYQEMARDSVLAEWAAGRLATLVQSAVGTGKTEMLLAVLEAEAASGALRRAVILAHREELVQQPVDRAAAHFPRLGPLGIVQGRLDDVTAAIIAATVQTLSDRSRFDRVIAHGPFSHLVIDEAHHGMADTYLRVVDWLRELNPALRILGTTATPGGGSGARRLGGLFQSVAFRFTLRQAIARGVLVPFAAVAVDLPVSYAQVPVGRDGDWQDGWAGSVMSRPDAMAIIVKAWLEHGGGRPTIAFTVSVQQAFDLAQTFKNAGVAAEAVHGGTPSDERADLLRRFKAGQVPIICNCAVLTEGVDLPVAACAIQAKPTKSDAAYIQMIGRVLRRHPSKTDALILDFVPKDARDLYSAADLRETLPSERQDRIAGQRSYAILGNGQEIEGTPDELRLRVLDYLAQDPLAWHFDGKIASAVIGAGRTVAVVALEGGEYALHVVEERQARPLATVDSWEDAVEAARRLVVEREQKILAERGPSWRQQPASEKQVDLLRKLGLWEFGITKGEAAARISHHFARRAVLRS